jgi:hypothetical protein
MRHKYTRGDSAYVFVQTVMKISWRKCSNFCYRSRGENRYIIIGNVYFEKEIISLLVCVCVCARASLFRREI